MASPSDHSRLCHNCGVRLEGAFCHRCGQDDRHYTRSLFGLVPEFLGELTNWDNRLWRTLWPLWLRPGYLSERYVEGHRAPYVPPLRLYIFTSIIAFLLFSLAIPYEPAVTPEADVMRPPPPTMELPLTSDSLNQELNLKLARLVENPALGISRFFSLAPQVMFLLLPLLALLLKLFYWRQGRFYIEHLILTLHNHSFLLQLALLAIGVLKLQSLAQGSAVLTALLAPVPAILLWSAPLYLLSSQKRFYRQSWGVTVVKFAGIGFLYSLLFFNALVVTIVISILRS